MAELSKGEIDAEKKRTQDVSIREGTAAAVMSGAGEAYIVPYALALNATGAQIGFLTSFVSLFGAISQIVGSKVSYGIARKKVILFSVFLQATTWILLIGLGFLFWKNIVQSYAAVILIVLYCFYAISGNLGGPAWFSMMGDIVPNEERGRYFSRRNRITSFASIVVTFIAAFFLDYTKNTISPVLGFIALFIIAALGRYVSLFLLSKHYDPERKVEKDSYFNFWQFVKKAPFNNYGKFVIFVGFINLAVNFAGPFFAVYMLKELNYSYAWFTLVNISSGIFTILSIPFWGKFGDRFGNKKMLKIGSVMISIVPFLWLLSGNPFVIIFTAQFFAGVGWAGFNLAASNFIYDAVTPERRSICVAYFSMLCGIGVFVGAMLGGLFIQYASIAFMNIYLFVFVISGILRAVFSAVFVPKIKEVRKTVPEGYGDVVSFILNNSPRPFYGMLREVISSISQMFHRTEKENYKSPTRPKS